MAHQVFVRPEFIEVVHTGHTGFADRLAALDSVRRIDQPGLPVLINFSGATLDDKAVPTEAIDYMARVITDPFFDNRCVAMVGLSQHAARPAELAASTRGIRFQVFESYERAVSWLIPHDSAG